MKALPALRRHTGPIDVVSGSGWLIGDCLWPVVCVVENLSGKAAVLRSAQPDDRLELRRARPRDPSRGAGGACIGDVVKSVSFVWGTGIGSTNNAAWFPIFAAFAAAPVFLYDRTAAQKEGPLLQLNRTPEIRITARPLSVSSIVWLALGAIYLIYEPLKPLAVWRGVKRPPTKLCRRAGPSMPLRFPMAGNDVGRTPGGPPGRKPAPWPACGYCESLLCDRRTRAAQARGPVRGPAPP